MARPLKSYPLVSSEPAASPPQAAPQRCVATAWLAIWLPNLPFDALHAAPREQPAAVVEPQRGQLCVVAVNDRAAALGVRPGLKLTAALALADALQVLERSPRLEQESLESLATWALRLTSLVHIEPPDGVLLEVAGSRKLFKTLTAIKSRMLRELQARGLQYRACIAPTGIAALWLARGGQSDVRELHELPGRFAELPVDVTRWPEEVRRLLREIGVRTLGECLRLPRAGFARRAGRQWLRELDLALGREPDGRPGYAPPRHWQMRSDVFEETSDCALLLGVVAQMLDRLGDTLRKEQRQIRQLRLVLAHRRHPPTVERFELLEPTHSQERLLRLVADRLERRVLPMPVVGLRLCAGPFEPLMPRAPELFARRRMEISPIELLERLRGRFGSEAVHGIDAVAEHRPERAWAKVLEPIVQPAGVPQRIQSRPLWLLPTALPLGSYAARAYYEGELKLRSGPERIESGWWDGNDIGRDYYRAVSASGQELWIYRDRSGEWHLHGLFG